MKTKFIALLVLFLPLHFAAFSQTDTNSFVIDSVEDEPFFLTPDFDYLKKVVDDKNSKFYYPKLLKRFNDVDTNLTLEELHCLYYGSALQEGYNPYGSGADEYVDKVREILNKDNPSKKQFKKALKYIDKAIKADPMNLDLYNYRHYIDVQLYGEDSPQADVDAFHFITLVSVIHFSGDGKNYSTAIYVISPSHEYAYLGYNGLRSQGQGLYADHGKRYDILTIAENDYGVEKLVFNIDICFNYLSSLFGTAEGTVDDDVEDVQMAGLSFSDDGEAELVADVDSSGVLAIPMGRRVVIRLDTILRDGHYGFEIVSDEKADGTYHFVDNEQYFPEEGEANTIIFYFVHSQWTDKRECEVLMMKSFCKEMLAYDTYILPLHGRPFQKTSNDGIFPGTRGTEIWNDPLRAIRISSFRPMK